MDTTVYHAKNAAEYQKEFDHVWAEREKAKKAYRRDDSHGRILAVWRKINDHQYEEALTLCEKLSPLFSLDARRLIYKRMGDFKKAYYSQLRYSEMRDSLNNVRNNHLLMEMTAAMDLGRVEIEAKELKLRNQQMQLDMAAEELEHKQLYFCLGDVSGKGVPASLFMAQAIRLFRALAKQRRKPSDIATRLNNELSEKNDNGMFVTMFIGKADLTTGHLYYCNAGHNPPLLDGEFIDVQSNAPIGLWPELDFEGEEPDNIIGKLLFIYTDGLNEAENLAQEQFSNDKLQQMMQEMKTQTARQVVDTFSQTVESHRNGAAPNDDLTMLAFRCH